MNTTQEIEPIFTGYQGNRISWKLMVFLKNEKYRLVFQKFDRTQPTKDERSAGIKKKRILLEQKIYFFTNLTGINTLKLPSPLLAEQFLKSHCL